MARSLPARPPARPPAFFFNPSDQFGSVAGREQMN